MAVYEFPEFAIIGHDKPVDYYIKIQIATQGFQSYTGYKFYAQPSWTNPTVCTVNPFLSIPDNGEHAEANAGVMGLETGSFAFLNIPVLATGERLWELLTAQNPENTCWNIRYFKRTSTGTYERPSFWGVLDMSEPPGDIPDFSDPDSWVIELNTKSPISQLEELNANWDFGNALETVVPWQNRFRPDDVFIDWPGSPAGYQNLTFVTSDGGANWINPRTCTYHRYVRLRDLADAVSYALTGRKVNDGASVNHSWTWFVRLNTAAATAVWDELYTLDLLQNSGTPNAVWGIANYDAGESSLRRLGSMLDVLKKVLLPYGLTARIGYTDKDANGISTGVWDYRYIEVVELVDSTVATLTEEDLLVDSEQESGERAVYGFRVSTLNSTEVSEGAQDGETLENPWLSATRLTSGARWADTAGTTDDLDALKQAVYVKWGDDLVTPYSVTVKADGQGSVTVDTTNDLESGGNFYSNAALAYYFNRAPYSADPIGIFRRYARQITVRALGLLPSVTSKQYRARTRLQIGSREYRILKHVEKPNDCLTEFVLEE